MVSRDWNAQRDGVTVSDPDGVVTDAAGRTEALRGVEQELEAWRARAIPDPAAPLEAEDVARLLRDCIRSVGVDPAVGEGFSVNTVHYYRRKDILDAPKGRTSAARYALRHLWQAVGARLAGHLGLLTLAEARSAMRRADDRTLLSFVAARILDARARHAMRDIAAAAPRSRGGIASHAIADPTGAGPRPLRAAPPPPVREHASGGAPAVIIPLPGDGWCVLPASHPAHHSVDAARDVVRALAAALHHASDAVLER